MEITINPKKLPKILNLTAQDFLDLEVIDEIIKRASWSGAHRDFEKTCEHIKELF